MKSISVLSTCFLLLTLFSCEEVIIIKSGEQQSQIAVEGRIVNKAGESYVQLSNTTSFFSSEAPSPISNATVSVKDSNDQTILFQEVEAGHYVAPADFKGVPGITYFLSVSVNNKLLTSESTMPDSVLFKSVRLELAIEDQPTKLKGYYLYGTLNDSSFISNYFMSEHYINGTRDQKTARDLQIFDDRFFEGLGDVEAMFGHWRNDEGDDIQLQKGDVITIRLYALDKPAYDYLKTLKDTPSQGGLYGKTPANVTSNIRGGLGLFQATTYTTSEVVVN